MEAEEGGKKRLAREKEHQSNRSESNANPKRNQGRASQVENEKQSVTVTL